MPDRRDDLDSWLDGRIDPLPPPPGTFDLIKKRARHRKYRKLAVGAGAAAVIVAAAVARTSRGRARAWLVKAPREMW